jgi:hypothetical protein
MSTQWDMSFGFSDSSMPDVARLLEDAFELEWTSRYSQHKGGVYYRSPGHDEEEFTLMSNRDVCDGEPIDEADPDEYPIVLRVEKTHRPAEIESVIGMIEGSLLIQSVEYPSDPD